MAGWIMIIGLVICIVGLIGVQIFEWKRDRELRKKTAERKKLRLKICMAGRNIGKVLVIKKITEPTNQTGE